MVARPQLPLNILKAVLRTQLKLVELGVPLPADLLTTLTQQVVVDSADRESEEVALLTIQKLIIKLLASHRTDDTDLHIASLRYILKTLKAKVSHGTLNF